MSETKNAADSLYRIVLAANLCFTGFYLWSCFGLRSARPLVQHMHSAAFTFSLGSAVSVLALFTLAWRVWMAWRYRPSPEADDAALPSLTVVIPAFNEGAQILPTVRSVMNSRYPAGKMQIVCVDDGSTDDTWAWMEQAAAEYPDRLRLIRQPQNGGKRAALMAGFREATGEIYVTVDSDSEVLPDTLRQLVSPFAADRRVGGVAGNVRVLNHGDGAIPKMMEVFFTASFDFIRAGQSVYGGVFCTPGALSAYRAAAVKNHLAAWATQTFMGAEATIGEDRALTNIILKQGSRVVYQREAVVLTKAPASFQSLRRMLLRWARSNVRESLVMATFMLQPFRRGDSGAGWIRFLGALQIVRLTLGEAMKIALLIQCLLYPAHTLSVMTFGCLTAALIPAAVYYIRRGGWFGLRWAVPYAFLSFYGLSWVSYYGLMSASRSGWLTRGVSTRKAALPAN